MASFRRLILEPIHQFGLAGWVGNDQYRQDRVFALLSGEASTLFTFTDLCEEYMDKRGVKMKVDESPISPEAFPLPAVRLPDSGNDIEDRFDRALDLLTEMRDGINRIEKNTRDIKEDTTQIRIDTNHIRADTSQIREDTAQIREDTAQIREDTALLPAIKEDTAQIREDTALLPAIKEDTALLPAIKEDTALLPAIKEDTTTLKNQSE